MSTELSAPLTAETPPQQRGSTLHWDETSGECSERGPHLLLAQGPQSSFQARGVGARGRHGERYWQTSEIQPLPALSPDEKVWEQEAGLTTFSLDAGCLKYAIPERLLGASGEVVWVPWAGQESVRFPLVYPVLRIQTLGEASGAEPVEIIPALAGDDLLRHHIALVLQAVSESHDLAGQVYAEALADALVVHFLRRYRASRRAWREAPGGLSPYKLQRTTAYIHEHLDQELSLPLLASVGEMSAGHFARLFKQATGRTPHQYVIARRMEAAKRLLAETDLSLSEISLRVGCADQSHFTALFHSHVSLTPRAYRDRAHEEALV